MEKIEELSLNLLKAVDNKDINAYKQCRLDIVKEIADKLFKVPSTNGLAIGKALIMILDDMSQAGILYKRIVVSALYSLLNIVVNDKTDSKTETRQAFPLLLILFTENMDFFGSEYLITKCGNNMNKTVNQMIGMTSVLYWKYNFTSNGIQFDARTENRLKKSIQSLPIKDIPEEETRNRLIDFEYQNFKVMCEDYQGDMSIKFSTLLDYRLEAISPSMFKKETLNIPYSSDINEKISHASASNVTKGNTLNSPKTNNVPTDTVSNSGCMVSLIIGIISVLSLFAIVGV